MSNWSAKNPYKTKVTECYILNGEGSRKETRHVVFALGDSGLDYKVGDALGVLAENPANTVDLLIETAGWDQDHMVTTHNGERTIWEALKKDFEIHRVNKKFVNSLTEKVNSNGMRITVKLIERYRESVAGQGSDWMGGDSAMNAELLPSIPGDDPAGRVENLTTDADAMEDYIWSRDYVDALGDFIGFGFTPQQFLEGMDRLKPRLYSIASSPDFEKGTVHLTVAIVRYNHHERDRAGLTTGFMADRCETDKTQIGVYMSPTRSFVLPEDGTKDTIMVGPGTGIAPFRAFLQQREINKDSGRNWLFFGDWTEEGEYLYRDEMDDWKERGIISKHDLAWSRQGSEKVYVQHLMEKNGEEIWNWIEGGAYFYVCGDKQYMAKDVHSTLIKICSDYGGMSLEDSKDFVENGLMKSEKRYLRDVY